jgi:cobalamin biosynthetic protein CobC
MSAAEPVFHGGDLAAATAQFGKPAAGWIDLSTGINPMPWPVDGAAAVESLARLPDSDALRDLEAAARAAYCAGPGVAAVAAPGTQALIQWLPHLFAPCRVAVVSPTYGEHAPAWRAAGHDVAAVPCLPAAEAADIVVLARPNNPDGRTADAAALDVLGRDLAAKGGLLVVDEAFADVTEDPTTAAPDRLALRSFGKFYGLPGLRLGFALCGADLADRLHAALGPWAVSSPAIDIGIGALSDRAWQAATRRRLVADAARLDALICGAGLAVVGGTTLFRLAAGEGATSLFDRLGRAGIYVRRFPENPRWLRFGLPGGEAAWARLERALAASGPAS